MFCKRNQLTGLIFIVFITMLFALNTSAKSYKLGLITPPQHIWTQAAQKFAHTLRKETQDQHQITVFPSRQLGTEAQMLQQLQTGALDMAFLTLAELSNRIEDFGAFYAPYLVKDIHEAGKLLRSDAAKKLLTQLPKKLHIYGVGYAMAGMRQIVSRKRVTSLEELQGQKIRITPFGPIRDFYKAIGTAPTPIPLTAVYNAFANGQVDAIDMDYELIWKLKYTDHAKTILFSNHMMFPMVGLVSMKLWATLNEADRGHIRSLMQKHLDNIVQSYETQEAQFKARVRKAGKPVLPIDAAFFGQQLKDWETQWHKKTSALAALKAALSEERTKATHAQRTSAQSLAHINADV